MPYRHSGNTVDFGDGRYARAVLPVEGGSSTWTVDNVSTTQARFTYAGTPTATASYSFSWMIME